MGNSIEFGFSRYRIPVNLKFGRDSDGKKVREGSLAVDAVYRESSLSNSLLDKEMAQSLSGTLGHRGSSEYLDRTGLGFR